MHFFVLDQSCRLKMSTEKMGKLKQNLIIDTMILCAIIESEDSGIDQLSLVLKQLTVSGCSRLWSQSVGYAVTTNRIDSSELKENA